MPANGKPNWKDVHNASAVVIALLLVLGVHNLAGQTRPSLPHIPGPEVKFPHTGQLPSVKLLIGYPSDFVESKLQLPREVLPFALGEPLVLIEASQLDANAAGNDNNDHSQAGIVIEPLTADGLRTIILPIIRPEWRCVIGTNVAYKLPGFPGPLGENAHCYLLMLENGAGVLFSANRFHNNDSKSPTHYDWVIERVIASARAAEN